MLQVVSLIVFIVSIFSYFENKRAKHPNENWRVLSLVVMVISFLLSVELILGLTLWFIFG